jgi:hypothetical protein
MAVAISMNGNKPHHPPQKKGGDQLLRIISNKPGFMARLALPIFLVLFIFAMSSVAFIHNPQIVRAQAVINLDYFPDGRKCAEVEISNKYFNLLRNKQSVMFHLNTAPFEKMGFISGEVKFVPNEDAENNFRVCIALPPTPGNYSFSGLLAQKRKIEIAIYIQDRTLLQSIFTSPVR